MTDKQIEPSLGAEVDASNDMANVDEVQGDDEQSVDWRETLPAAEFCCWVVVLLAPILRWVNGAAVTDDQFYIQVALVTLALAGAISLRVWNSLRARKV